MGAETDLSPPPLQPTASPEPEILRNDDRDWKADMMSALGESVSFGRFLSEPLEWGKWSAFEHNRYLEEAAGQSRPGSVAQKKAFFEEHYARKRKSEADADADEDDARDVDTDAAYGGVACWSPADSSCMTDDVTPDRYPCLGFGCWCLYMGLAQLGSTWSSMDKGAREGTEMAEKK